MRHWVILGGGALGTILGALLTRGGHRVQVLARGARADCLARNGLRVHGLAEVSVPCDLVRDPGHLSGCDVFVNTVKTYDSTAALAALPALRPAVAFSVQNGVVKEEELASAFGAAAVLGAMADFSGDLEPDGRVHFSRNVGLYLGETDGGTTPRLTALAHELAQAGLAAQAVPHVQSLIWSKFCGWVGLVLAAVLTRRSTGEYLQDPDAARIIVRLARETAQLAARRAIPLVDISPMPTASLLRGTEQEAVALVRATGVAMAAHAPGHRLSALQDLLRGRRLELDETVGWALREGTRLGVAMPTVETCLSLARALSRAGVAS